VYKRKLKGGFHYGKPIIYKEVIKMNIIKFITPNVKENTRYRGNIIDYTVDAERYILRIYVTINREPEVRFMKRVDIELEINSYFYSLCNELGVLNDDGTADLDLLIDTKVLVTLKQGNDEKFYINKIKRDEQHYQEQEYSNE